MQAAIARFADDVIATPFGRAAVDAVHRLRSVVASNQVRLAAPRFVTRTLP
jgi:hypothetical protein